jgi:hypothetical protein
MNFQNSIKRKEDAGTETNIEQSKAVDLLDNDNLLHSVSINQ